MNKKDLEDLNIEINLYVENKTKENIKDFICSNYYIKEEDLDSIVNTIYNKNK